MAVLQGSAKSVADGGFYPTEIAQSLRFNDDSNDSLTRTPSTAGNLKTLTWSGWVKRGNLGSPNKFLFSAGPSSTYYMGIYFNADDELEYLAYPNTFTSGAATVARFRDPSAWYHIVFVLDTTQATSSDRIQIYVNGVRQTLQAGAFTLTYPPLNDSGYFNNTNPHYIGSHANTAVDFDGYIAELHYCDGTAYTADDFGEFKSGVWVAKTPSVTYGTNGFYLDFADGGALGTDVSGEGNNWTPTNLAATDQMLDSPTNNFATLNSVYPNPSNVSVNTTLAEGNLKSTVATGSAVTIDRAATLGMTSGKWYWECKIDAISAPNGGGHTGIRSATGTSYLLSNNGLVYTNWTTPTYSGNSSYVAGDVLGVAYDADNGDLYFYKNGVVGNGGTPILTGLTGEWYPTAFNLRDTTTSGASTHNFGQDSSFAGTKTPQGYTDANGIGDFYYTPPTGYLALCTDTLPAPAIEQPETQFNVVTYTGDGTSSNAITGVGFQPDFVWIKRRDAVQSHILSNSVNGAGVALVSNVTSAEFSIPSEFLSFDSDGFTVGYSTAITNNSGSPYVAWCWKAGGTAVTNTNGSITSQVSANVDAGFSIVSWTGTATAGTIGHGLTSAPEFIITKRRNYTTAWHCYSETLGNTNGLYLNDTAASTAFGPTWNSTSPTSSVFSVGSGDWINQGTMIAYCFHSVEGFSKFGSYTGNGSADGPFIYTGFRPSFVLIKSSTFVGTRWVMHDSARSLENLTDQRLYANENLAEYGDDGYGVDFLSNGFKVRTSDGYWNASGQTYIYMAFAENPFKYSNAR